MSFWSLALRGLLRRRMRSLLTVSGIALGIATVVTLTAISWGFERSWQQANDARGTDLLVTRATSENTLPAPFDASLAEGLRRIEGVHEVAGLLSGLLTVEGAPLFVFGWEPRSFLWDHLRLVEGRWPAPGRREAALGALAAETAGRGVGDAIRIGAERFAVSGIYQSAAFIENGALVVELPQAQRLSDKAGKVNVLNIKLAPGADAARMNAVRETVRRRLPGFAAVSSGELVRHNTVVRVAKAMSVATALIAALIGAVSVLNTMLMSIFERTREIGLLLAVGWTRSRVVRLILVETLWLALAGGVAGIALGMGGTALVERLPIVHGKIHGHITPGLMAVAALMAAGMALLGGLYPAWRAARLSPTEALRHE